MKEKKLKNLLFVGSGATAALGFKTTENLGKYIVDVCDKKKEAFNGLEGKDSEEVFRLLEGQSTSSYQKWFSSLYSFDVLRASVGRLRYKVKKENMVDLLKLYNFLDMHITSGLGLQLDDRLVRTDEFIQARRLLDNLLTFRHQIDYKMMSQDVYIHYQEFARFLAKRMQREGIQLQHYNKRSRDFYLFSYAVISMNWDPIFLWLLFNAHREANSSPPYVGNPARPLKLYHDFAHPMYMRKIDDQPYQASTWFPMNEGAAYRLNDERKDSSYFVRLGKFYFPHGSHNFRKCENCGKLNIFLGDEWAYDSNTLFPPSVFLPSSEHRPFSKKEEAARKDAPDAQECVHCGEMTYMYQTDIVTQTSFKGSHSAYLEEIQRDMKVMIEQAEHIILFGYSLPPDDAIYQSVLAAKHREGQKVTIVSGKSSVKGVEDEWVVGEQITEQFKAGDTAYEVYQSLQHLFQPNNIRAYAGYIPDVFVQNESFSEQKASHIFHWPNE